MVGGVAHLKFSVQRLERKKEVGKSVSLVLQFISSFFISSRMAKLEDDLIQFSFCSFNL